MTTQHTEGPLRVTETFDLESQDGFTVAVCVDCAQFDADGMTTTANARRLAACWNALQGVPTEEIESIIKIGMPAFSNMDAFLTLLQARRQRDELNELNAELVASLEHILAGSLSLPRFAEQEARVAIAKAKEQA